MPEENPMKDSITILAHGFNRTKSDMRYMERGLSDFGFQTFSVHLPALFGSLEDCRNAMHSQVGDIVRDFRVVNYAAHSFGGLVVRSYIESLGQENVGRCVFIAAPHRGSKLARTAKFIPLYTRIFRPLDDMAGYRDESSIRRERSFPVGLIAGNHNNLLLGKIFLSDESDGRVEVSSVESDDASDYIVLPFGHHEIHHQRRTLELVRNFLANGAF